MRYGPGRDPAEQGDNMLQFREFAVADRALLEPILFRQPYRLCDHSFACCFIWQEN